MASNDDWVADVKRWCRSAQGQAAAEAGPAHTAGADAVASIGYEAAHPALQAQHWPDAPPPEGAR